MGHYFKKTNGVENNDLIKLKAYKLLSEIRGRILARIQNDAINKVQYSKDDSKELLELLQFIANPEKWDYSGLCSKTDKEVLEVLEYLLNDNSTEIFRRKAPSSF